MLASQGSVCETWSVTDILACVVVGRRPGGSFHTSSHALLLLHVCVGCRSPLHSSDSSGFAFPLLDVAVAGLSASDQLPHLA